MKTLLLSLLLFLPCAAKAGTQIQSSDVNSVVISSAGAWYGTTINNVVNPQQFGSTFTVTTGAYNLKITLSAMLNTVSGGVAACNVLMDSLYIDDFNSTKWQLAFENNSASNVYIQSEKSHRTASAVSAGLHRFSVVCIANGPSQNVYCGASGMTGGHKGSCELVIEEVK
jgi:hypothetical protein